MSQTLFLTIEVPAPATPDFSLASALSLLFESTAYRELVKEIPKISLTAKHRDYPSCSSDGWEIEVRTGAGVLLVAHVVRRPV